MLSSFCSVFGLAYKLLGTVGASSHTCRLCMKYTVLSPSLVSPSSWVLFFPDIVPTSAFFLTHHLVSPSLKISSSLYTPLWQWARVHIVVEAFGFQLPRTVSQFHEREAFESPLSLHSMKKLSRPSTCRTGLLPSQQKRYYELSALQGQLMVTGLMFSLSPT